MYPDKKNILETVALLLAHDITDIVLSPGSRNAPLAHSFSQNGNFTCYSVVDERSAAFFAIGLILNLKKPVALCCTSGTALSNYASAIAEAFYQHLPLLVISADRPLSWIGQFDGQTIPQTGIFGSLVRKSVQLPDIRSDEDLWYCNRLVNEAILALNQDGCAPTHINIPIAEPLNNYTVDKLPDVRVIRNIPVQRTLSGKDAANNWNHASRRMILAGQLLPDSPVIPLLQRLKREQDVVVLAEHISNLPEVEPVENFDALIGTLTPEEEPVFTPDLVISFGGHLVSKQIKRLLRKHRPKQFWQICENGEIADTYQSLTAVVKSTPEEFFSSLVHEITPKEEKHFSSLWNSKSENVHKKINAYISQINFSDLSVFAAVCKRLPRDSAFHIGNSTPIRYSQLFGIPSGVKIFSNRGTSGIDGTVSTATGFSARFSGITLLAVGDLGFFYDMNALRNIRYTSNLRILLLNNGGGNIFRMIKNTSGSVALNEYIACDHNTSAQGWCDSVGLKYQSCHSDSQLNDALDFLLDDREGSRLLEVFTTGTENTIAFKGLFNHLKNNI